MRWNVVVKGVKRPRTERFQCDVMQFATLITWIEDPTTNVREQIACSGASMCGVQFCSAECPYSKKTAS